MGKMFGFLRKNCRSILPESQHCPGQFNETGDNNSMKRKKRVQLREHLSSWDYTHGPVGLYNIGETCLNVLIPVFIMNMGFTKILKRIAVPKGAEEQERSIPLQLLLLLEKKQDSQQKAVQPMELAYCLQKYNVPYKILL
ncbi:ubl carboxyl-terminal hydrolase 18-like [Thomomys bottae]